MSIENEVQVTAEAAEAEQVVLPVEVQETPEPSADDALQAGFNAVNGIEPPAPEPAPEVKRFAGYTEDELKKKLEKIEALEQRESKVFGSLGSLKQSLESMRSAQQAPKQTVKFTPDSLKRLSAEYPEMAKLLAEDLGDIPASSDSVQVEQIVEQRVQTSLEKTKQAYEQRFLSIAHPDWKKVVAADDFIGWKESLPAEEKAELDASWDAEFIGEKLSKFKDWKAQSSQAKQTNQRRLEAAIAPKSSGSNRPAPTETDAFLAGFKSVRG